MVIDLIQQHGRAKAKFLKQTTGDEEGLGEMDR